MIACESGFEDVARCLLEAKANPCCTDKKGWVPLCHALAAGELGIAESLMEHTPAESWEMHKAFVRKIEDEIVKACEDNAGEAACAALRLALAGSPGTFLAGAP